MSGSLANVLAYQPPAPSVPVAIKGMTDDGTLLTQLVQWFEEAEWSGYEHRLLSQRDRDYVDSKQLTEAELAVLKRRGQPPLIINRISRKINYLKGFERRLRSDPKAFPRNPQDEQNADAATQALRYIADDNSFDQVRSSVWDNMIVEGLGGAESVAEQGPDGVEIRNHHVAWDRLWADPHSAKLNYTDARYMGTVLWMDRDQALDIYPDSENAIESTVQSPAWAYDDRPRSTNWVDSRRTRVRIVQCHWQQRNYWYTGTFMRGGFLEPPTLSPYIDRRGKTCSPLRLRACYKDRNNHPYGIVRELVSPQDEYNKRRSKALHRITTQRIIMDEGAVQDVDKAKREVAKPDGVIVVNKGFKFEIDRDNQGLTGEIELMHHIAGEIDLAGPNSAMSGKDPREQSGRAIQAQQQGGAVETEPLIDGLRQWDREMYEANWMRVRQFWTGPKWIRVTNDERNVKFVGLNRPITVKDELANMPDDQRANVMQQMQLVPGDPRLDQVIRTENDVSDLDVDITVEDGPDISTLQSEQFNQLTQMVQAGLPIPPEVIIKASSLRNKDDLLKSMEQAKAQAQQSQAAQQQQNAMMEEAKLNKIKADTANAMADAADRQVAAIQKTHEMAKDHAALSAPPEQAAPAMAALTGDGQQNDINPGAALAPQPGLGQTPGNALGMPTQ